MISLQELSYCTWDSFYLKCLPCALSRKCWLLGWRGAGGTLSVRIQPLDRGALEDLSFCTLSEFCFVLLISVCKMVLQYQEALGPPEILPGGERVAPICLSRHFAFSQIVSSLQPALCHLHFGQHWLQAVYQPLQYRRCFRPSCFSCRPSKYDT